MLYKVLKSSSTLLWKSGMMRFIALDVNFCPNDTTIDTLQDLRLGHITTL